MNTVWILLADQARARLFATDETRDIREVEDVIHPEGEKHERELAQDSPGRAYDSRQQSHRHAMETRMSPKEQEAVYFAQYLTQHLDKAHKAGRFESLVLAAPPDFLGLLRDALTERLRQCVVLELNKHLTQIRQPDELRAYLPEHFPSALTQLNP